MPIASDLPAVAYFPAIVRDECDSPIDALVLLGVPRDEATDLVAATWNDWDEEAARAQDCILCDIDGGRPVAVLRTPEGRWAACNAFPEKACGERREAERVLAKLLKRGRRGLVAEWKRG
ncbi:MAG: hypothetical protein C0466_00220 [Candidatus Accumulibacter sp.]|nr:hypothetical protein [Accumulibacter sp.]